MSVTSSPGRRPLGKPARSPATAPQRLACASAAVAGIAMFSRSISEGVTVDSWFTPSRPVRNAVTRSCRGRFEGAMFPSAPSGSRNSTSISAGNVGWVTYSAN